MAVFRLQEHAPDAYTRKSRDFQLLCNVFDCMNGGVKFDIDSIRDITDTHYCNDKLLNFLQTKLGFFTSHPMTAQTQRIILKAFPYIIKNKGSRKGIEQAIQVFLKTQGIYGKVSVSPNNKQLVTDVDTGLSHIENIYVVELGIQSKSLETSLLTEILNYIIPAGYIVRYSFYSGKNIQNIIYDSDIIDIIFVDKSLNSGVVLSGTNNNSLNAVGTTTVAPGSITKTSSLNEAQSFDSVDSTTNIFHKTIGDEE